VKNATLNFRVIAEIYTDEICLAGGEAAGEYLFSLLKPNTSIIFVVIE